MNAIVLFILTLLIGMSAAHGEDIVFPSDLQALLQIEADMDPKGALGWSQAAQDLPNTADTDVQGNFSPRWNGVVWTNDMPKRVGAISMRGCGKLVGWSSGFGKLTEIWLLDLDYNSITSVQGVSNIKNIHTLTLRDNNITNIDEITNLPNLLTLDVSDNPIVSKIRFEGMDSLEQLILTAELEDVQGLADLPSLTRLALVKCRIGDIGAIGDLPKLSHLGIFNCQLDDLSTLGKLRNISTLFIANKPLKSSESKEPFHSPPFFSRTDLRELRGMDKLRHLTVRYNRLNDISGLRGMPLATLRLDHNEMTDISPLENMGTLTELSLEYNAISNLEPISGFSGLVNCFLTGNKITDISPLATHHELELIRLGENEIFDLSPLGDLNPYYS